MGLVAIAWSGGGCSGGDSGPDAALVVVPNDVLADIVERVGCVGEIDVHVGRLPVDDERVAEIELLLSDVDKPDGDDTLVVAIPEVVSTFDGRDGDIDPSIWMDPSRLAALVPAIAGAMVAGAGLDAELVDRCVARVLSEFEQVDVAVAERLAELGEEDRIIDVSEPGVGYFASHYDLAASTRPLAIEASAAVVVDSLGGAESYDEMMLDNADRIVAVFD